MTTRRRLACAAGLSFMVAGSTGCRDDDSILHVGESIRPDDFLHTVLAAHLVPRIGDRAAHGQYLVVHFEVANRAGRVAHAWSNAIAYLVDAHGRRYENDATLQQALDRLRPSGGLPGTSPKRRRRRRRCSSFDVPADAPRPLDIMVRGELLMGDVLDGVRFRRARVRVP